jgi:uncharacterized protein (TIGR03000 family)
MFRFSIGASVAALALWVGAAGPANAQHHGGGGHGGGGHGGVPAAGGLRAGGIHAGNVHPGNFHSGNFHSGNFHSGNFHHDGFRNNGVFLGVGIGGFGGYPYYGGYGYRNYGYGYPYYGGYGYGSAYVYPSAVYNSYYVPSVNVVPAYPETTQSLYYTPGTDVRPANDVQPGGDITPPAGNRARVHVRLPADATLLVDGDATQQTGAERDFVTPPLTPGTTYTYTLKARWMQGDQPVEKTLKVDVQANQTSLADFNR